MYASMIAITRLLQMFPFNGSTPALARRSDDLAQREMEKVRDFVILHYVLNQRPEPFWQRMREMEMPDSLADRSAVWREAAHAWKGADDLFQVDSWVQVMLGQRLELQAQHQLTRMMPPERLRQAFADMRAGVAASVARLPSHQQFLDRYGAAAPNPLTA